MHSTGGAHLDFFLEKVTIFNVCLLGFKNPVSIALLAIVRGIWSVSRSFGLALLEEWTKAIVDSPQLLLGKVGGGRKSFPSRWTGLGRELPKAEGVNLVLTPDYPGTWRQAALELCSHQRPSGIPMGRAIIWLCPPPSGHSQLRTKVKLELLTRFIPNLTIVKHHTSLTESAGATTRGNVCV